MNQFSLQLSSTQNGTRHVREIAPCTCDPLRAEKHLDCKHRIFWIREASF